MIGKLSETPSFAASWQLLPVLILVAVFGTAIFPGAAVSAEGSKAAAAQEGGQPAKKGKKDADCE